MLSKVPQVTVWFWIIKILCTTVGESVADWINVGLGNGLIATALIFTMALALVLTGQLWLNRYVPAVYWLAVVILSVAGTLYTDILTDSLGVPLALSTAVFAVVLAVVFAVWYARERTLSIHSIVTTPREVFYWLAVLVTFALGTAVGDWTIALTGWSPGISVLLPAGLIVAILVGYSLGANAVLSFWLAYVLTRPLGANLGDWFASPSTQHGLGLGYGITSVIFLATILVAVVYLTRSRADVIGAPDETGPAIKAHPTRERIMLGYYIMVAGVAAALLVWAADRPHAVLASAGEGDETASPTSAAPTPGRAIAHFPAAEVSKLRTITQDTLARLQAGDQAGATARVKDLETAWDDDQSALQPIDPSGWKSVDGQIDNVLKALRARNPDRVAETRSLNTLLENLS
ncbi:MAG: hypothetical protein NVS4B6_16120 [Mycobacterium sp.]